MKKYNGVLRNTIISGIGWTYSEKLLTQIVSFFVSIILARLLSPEDYGILALVNIFIGIASAIALSGFGSALIQRKEADNLDFSSTLFFSLGVSLISYIILFFTSPLIAKFYNLADLVPIIRIVSLSIVISSINTVQHAYVIRKMLFRLFFLATFVGSIISAMIGILMAYGGFGVWALVTQYLSNSIINIIMLTFISDWRPEFKFSLTRIKAIYSFGWKITVSAVIDALYTQSRSIAIGKKYTVSDLAFYDKGSQFPNLIITNINSTISHVLMPVISSAQDDLPRVKAMVRRSLKTSSVILFPVLIGLAACAKGLIPLLLTQKWLPSVPYMQILCFAFMMRPIQTANLQGILAIGRSDIYLRIQLVQKIIGIVIIAITILFFRTVVAVAIGEIVAQVLFSLIMIIPNSRYLNYSIEEQIVDILPQMFVAIVMGVIVLQVLKFELSILAALVLQVTIGAIFYVGSLRLLQIDSFMYLYRMLIEKVKNINYYL
jgi:O-antigen/teichoic acid export membrane protein